MDSYIAIHILIFLLFINSLTSFEFRNTRFFSKGTTYKLFRYIVSGWCWDFAASTWMVPRAVQAHHVFRRFQPILERWFQKSRLDSYQGISLWRRICIFLTQTFSHTFCSILGYRHFPQLDLLVLLYLSQLFRQVFKALLLFHVVFLGRLFILLQFFESMF